MIRIEGRHIIADTKTQTLLFTDGRLTQATSKLDQKTYLRDISSEDIPLTLVYAQGTTLPLGKAAHAHMDIVRYSDHVVNLSFDTWNGHGELLIEEETETGAVCVTPSVHTSRPGVFACRWDIRGLEPGLSVTLPFLQGFRARLDDPILKWEIFRDLRYPYRWEDNFVAFGNDAGGIWIHSEGSRNRFKFLHIGSEESPYCAAFDTQNCGPIEDLLSAGGVTWKLNVYTGNWTVPVLSYREVLKKEPAWEASRATLPDWFSDIKLAYCWCPTDPKILDILKEHIDPKHVLIHLPHWRIHKYDQQYPDYTASPEAAEFIRKGTRMGYHIAPHFNCYEIDPSLPEFELVRDFRYRDVENGQVWGWGFRFSETDWGIPEGNTTLRSSRSRNVMTKIHPALPAWRNLFASHVKKAVDEIGLHRAFLDTSHKTLNLRNGLFNDTNTIDGARELFTLVQKINGGLALGGEGMNETLLFQHFAQGHSMYHGPELEMIPVENYAPVNHLLFGELCHLIGYHNQKTYERRMQQDACDEKRGFLPTLLGDMIYDLDQERSVSRHILQRAVQFK